MPDPRFFKAHGPFTLAELAARAGARLHAGADPASKFRDVAPLDSAGQEEVSFLDNKLYVEAFRKSRAGACVVHEARVAAAPRGMALLLSENPYRAYALIAQTFYPRTQSGRGIAANASVHPSAKIAADAVVGPGASVAAGAEIGARCSIGANAVIGEGVILGDDTEIGPCASVRYAVVGRRCIIFAGARIGEDGFGFAPDPAGHVKVPQLGRVMIEDDVEIGANATIDRGAGPDTVIGAGSRIDNLVQIGHNVRLGRGCIVVAQAGISGSTRLEDYVVIAAQGGLTGHLTIGKGARIGAQAGVMRDVPAGVSIMGSPAVPVKQFFRQQVTLTRLAKKERD
jgi:UDP-3-O-[3-hydroxymyristoyl] glucosamine N-acyltransferase